jgi:glutathione S-transferase
MSKIVTDRLRPASQHDDFGVTQAKAALEMAYGIIDQELGKNTWATGEAFSMADCAAAPALFYANLVVPIGGAHAITAAYLSRLMARPSVARVAKEAEPYFKLFPR